MTSAVYPAATGSRFEHSLGAMSLATRAWRAAWSNARSPDVRAEFHASAQEDAAELRLPAQQPQFFELTELAVAGAALLHDLGHPPFSHVLERFCGRQTPTYFEEEPLLLDMWERSDGVFHEFAGLQLAFEVTRQLNEPLRSTLRAVLRADTDDGSWLGTLHSMIAGEIDIDRLDYLIGDAQKAGTEFGAIDYARLVDAYELHREGDGFAAAPGVRARSAVETLLLQRTQAYKWISFHPRVVCANLALGRSLELLHELAVRRDPVRIAGTDVTSAEIFAGLVPMLNYISPRDIDLASYAGGLGPEHMATNVQMDLVTGGSPGPHAELRQAVQSSVDDAVVLESLKRARAAAQAMSGSMTADEQYRGVVARFLTYSGCVLFRHKNVIPAWKTVEEFQAAAIDMRDELREVVNASYRHFLLEPRILAHEETKEAVEAECDALLATFGGPGAQAPERAVLGLNELLAMVFDEAPYKDELARDLSARFYSLDGISGFWDVEYTGFTAVREDDGAFLFNGDDRVRIFDSSPIARALQQVEQSRARLSVYFFLSHPARVPVGEPGTAQERRAKLIGEFVDVFPRFVERVLPAILADTYQPPISRMEDPSAPSS